MSSPPNPFLESPPAGTELPAPDLHPASRPPTENPAWTGWDVFSIAIVMLTTPAVLYALILGIAHEFIYRGLPWARMGQKPTFALVAQFLAYVVVLLFMIALVEGKYHIPFLRALGWNWPHPNRARASLAAFGVALLVGLQGLAHLFPIPKNVPFDQLFQHPLDAYLTSIFAISLGPFMEEVFFRGFLYPVLARRLGILTAIFLTALGFGLLHAMQLGFAWGPVFIIFLVGVALTAIRAVTRSVGASFIVHVAYNFSLMALTFAATAGFRHLERLNQ